MEIILSNQVISLKLCKLFLLLQHHYIIIDEQNFFNPVKNQNIRKKTKKMSLYFILAHGTLKPPTMLGLSDQAPISIPSKKNCFETFWIG